MLELEAEFANFQRQTLRTITPNKSGRSCSWRTTFHDCGPLRRTETRDRKRMLRLLIKDITVAKGPEQKLLRLKIRWQGGMTEVVEIRLPANRPDAIRYPVAVIDRVRELACEHDDEDIAALFNREASQAQPASPSPPA